MCGIAGFTQLGAPAQDAETILRRMMASIAARGPDGEGVHIGRGIVLGHRRLSIIDLEGGAQPMRSRDGRYHIVYNGEIYNYLELRTGLEARGCVFHTHSDTEVLLEQFALDGVDALQVCNGMFACAIWDEVEKRLFLARDRIGVKPLYYSVQKGELIFGSELKAVLAHPRIERRLEPLSVSKYFTYGYIPAPHTIFSGIRKLEPGSYLFFDRNGLHLGRYWDIPLEDNPVSDRNVDEWAEDLLILLRDSVEKRLRSDVPVGLFLSGGLDSSTVTALAAQQSSNRLHSFSIGFDDPSYDESPHARRVAAFCGTEHHEKILTLQHATDLFPEIMRKLDEPLADASMIPTYFLSQLAAEHVKVVLGGDGADELFAGYAAFQAHKLVQNLSFLPAGWRDWLRHIVQRLPVSHRYASAEFLMQQFVKGLGLSPEVRFLLWLGCYGNAEKKRLLSAGLQESLLREDAFEDISHYIRQSGLKSDFQRLQYLCLKLYLQDDILLKVDRASMAHSLEVRGPFLDRDVVEFASRIRPEDKLRGLTVKYVLKRAVRHLLPDEIINRRKAGFMMPVALWLQQSMRPTIEDLCSGPAVAETGLFDPVFVRQILDEHFAGRCDHRKQIYPLLCFMAWYRHYAPTNLSA
ncbi:MAG TPA: asparagine synthase (glutamine-hydrolyzing) [Chthoniobacterales bacterium]